MAETAAASETHGLMIPLFVALLVTAMAVTRPAVRPYPIVADSSHPTARVDVQLDQRSREMVVTVGPFHVPQSMPMDHAEMMLMQGAEFLAGTFDWPVTTQYHSVKLTVFDGRGALPRRLLHHTYMVNFDRRQLVHPITERSFSFGQETADHVVPATIGMPMTRGQHMGVLVMWDNQSGRELDDVYIRYSFRLNPRRQWPAPMPVMPFFVDVHMVAGGLDTFSVAPGGRTVSRDFTVPVSGRLIAASGHMHDHGDYVRLEDAASGKDLLTVNARRQADGVVTSVSRELPGLWGRGPRLTAGRRYRLVVRYDNPTADTLIGMMGMMGGLFVPDRPGEWPSIDANDPDYLADLRGLRGPATLVATPAHHH